MQTLVERYLVLVHSSALRRTGDAVQAAEVTRAVFLVLARRARRLRKKTMLAGWLFQVAAVACRKLKRIGPMPNPIRPEGFWLLRNPRARRSGLVGVLGFEFDWTHADFELGGVAFTNVAARVKGNERSWYEPTRAYKVDRNKFTPGQKLGGLDELTFNSLVWNDSRLGEALGFEFLREAERDH